MLNILLVGKPIGHLARESFLLRECDLPIAPVFDHVASGVTPLSSVLNQKGQPNSNSVPLNQEAINVATAKDKKNESDSVKVNLPSKPMEDIDIDAMLEIEDSMRENAGKNDSVNLSNPDTNGYTGKSGKHNMTETADDFGDLSDLYIADDDTACVLKEQRKASIAHQIKAEVALNSLKANQNNSSNRKSSDNTGFSSTPITKRLKKNNKLH